MCRVIPRICSEGTYRRSRPRSMKSHACKEIIQVINRYKSFLDLKTSSVHNDKEQVDVLERMIGYLRNSDKDSMVSYMYV